MTKLERIRTTAAIPAAFRGSSRIAKSLELIEARAAGGTIEFKSTVWKAAKPQLKVETGGKCAYCESPTDTVAHGDVEHSRPKSKYWWLAYCDFLIAAGKEKAGLVDPYVTDPDPLFKWVANDVLKIVELARASNKVAAKRAFAGTKESYGLNREELKRTRTTRTRSSCFLRTRSPRSRPTELIRRCSSASAI